MTREARSNHCIVTYPPHRLPRPLVRVNAAHAAMPVPAAKAPRQRAETDREAFAVAKARDRAAGPDRLILPALQQGKQPFWARLQLLARLTLNPGKQAGNEPARLAQLDDGNDRAILVQGDEGSAQLRFWARRRRVPFGAILYWRCRAI